MKKENILFTTVFCLFILLLASCKKNNIYDEMPLGKDLTIAYEKLLKEYKLEKDSTKSFYEIGASFVVYPDNKVEQNQASVYIIVEQKDKGYYKYIYNMTTDKLDSYSVNIADSFGPVFAHQLFPSFENLDFVRDSLLKKAEMVNPQIANLRFYINSDSGKPEIEAIIEDVKNPDNSKTLVSDISGHIIQ